MTHVFASSFQQACRIVQRCATEETNVDMGFKDVDITECCIFYASDRAAVVHQFSHIAAALSHLRKPPLRNRMQLIPAFGQPDVDAIVPYICFWETEQAIHSQDLSKDSLT